MVNIATIANKISVTLTLIRTNASMIEVKVCNSASAMLPQKEGSLWSKNPVFCGENRKTDVLANPPVMQNPGL